MIETDRIQQLAQIMQRLHKNNQQLKIQNGIAHSEYMILQFIYCAQNKGTSTTISELSEVVQISKPAVSQMINALESKQWVERQPSKQDRRIVHVVLTEQGLEIVNTIRAFLSNRLILILEKMGAEDADDFLRLLDKFTNIMSEV